MSDNFANEDDWTFDPTPAPLWQVTLRNIRNNAEPKYTVRAWSKDQAVNDVINARKVPSDYAWVSAKKI